MSHPRNDHLSLDDLLCFYIGEIVCWSHSIFKSFNVGGALANVTLGDRFEARRRIWWADLSEAFSDDPHQLTRLRALNDRIVKTKDLRDALVHGGPRIDSSPGLPKVVCHIHSPTTRYRQRAYRYWLNVHRQIPVERRSLSWRVAAREMASREDIELSYLLDEVAQAASDIRVINFEVMSLTGDFGKLKFGGYMAH